MITGVEVQLTIVGVESTETEVNCFYYSSKLRKLLLLLIKVKKMYIKVIDTGRFARTIFSATPRCNVLTIRCVVLKPSLRIVSCNITLNNYRNILINQIARGTPRKVNQSFNRNI